MHAEMARIHGLVDKLDGGLAAREGELLYHLARNSMGKGVIVEIGSWKGKSTIWLAKGSKAGTGAKVYAIDPHTGTSLHAWAGNESTLAEFLQNIQEADVNDIVVPLVKASAEAANGLDEPVELLFVDGDHEYESVKLDYDTWFPKVINGGVIAFHDSMAAPGVRRVIEGDICGSRYFRNVRFVDSITFAQKSRQISIGDKLKNRYIMYLRDFYWFGARVHLPTSVRAIGNELVRMLQR